MMKPVVTTLLSLWLLSALVIMSVSSNIVDNICGASLTFTYDATSDLGRTYYDFRTGIQHQPPFEFTNRQISPNAQYAYETSGNNDIFLTALATGSRDRLFSAPFITDTQWSYDSHALIIWELDSAESQVYLMSVDITTGDINFEHQFPNSIGRRREASPNNRYIYVQFWIDIMLGRHGTIFIDTVTGEQTRFAKASEFPYIWSADNQLVLSHSQAGFFIIDPTTGDYHHNTPESINGVRPIWNEDNIWFTRFEDNHPTVWRYSLVDNSEAPMISDAEIWAISPDETWAYLKHIHSNNATLYHLPKNKEYILPFNFESIFVLDSVAFTQDMTCVAVKSYHNFQSHIVIYDLTTMNLIHNTTILLANSTRLEWVE